MRYEMLLRVLDRIRDEAPTEQSNRYRPDASDLEKVNQARARAFIHLYLKVMFGITDFIDRERTITDSSGDGGIDGYFIDVENRTIHLLQSKFRTTEKNFEVKEISLEEMLSMDINRILEGETADENGTPYNGKIRQLQREISTLPDVARYSYRVAVLANLNGVSPSKLRQLTGGLSAEIFNFEKAYERLVFPVIAGTYFTASDIVIPMDLSNKNAGSKISYNVKTRFGDCEITVLFVPTIEIAKLMYKYKNSILKHNPRSYLEMEGQAVNKAIRDTITNSSSNEFALFNNGITMLSEETNINEKIGQKNKAQLRIKNPQIINGGQTSFTLSRIYSEDIPGAHARFLEKEVLLKIITLLDNGPESAKVNLIDDISNATNKQTPVINADRYANEAFHLDVQRMIFDRYGLLYERKRGEFADGIRDGYVSPPQIIERNHFWRLYFTANGKLNLGFQKRLFQRNRFPNVHISDTDAFDRLFLAVHVFRHIRKGLKPNKRVERDQYAKVYAYIRMFEHLGLHTDESLMSSNLTQMEEKWRSFIAECPKRPGAWHRERVYKSTGERRTFVSMPRYLRSEQFELDMQSYFSSRGNANETSPS